MSVPQVRRALIVFLFIGSFASAALAQEATILQGKVVDEQRALVVAAQVSLDDGRGHKYSTLTDKQGQYRVVAVSPGTYTLTASAAGFAEFTEHVELPPSRLTTLDITLRITLKEQLEVRAARDSLTLATYAGQNLAALSQDPRRLPRQLRQLARAAGASGEPAIYVDGFREEGRLPPRDAIEEVRITSNSFAAELAEPGEARVEITTKPATKSFHGELNFSFNDTSLNARHPFALRRAPFQIRDYSVTLSGPIKHNRLGYFLDLGRTEENGNTIVNATILNSATLLPEIFNTTVLTPSRDTNFSFRTNYALGRRHQLDFSYSHSRAVEQNQGLEDGFDLPERAANTKSRDDLLRLSLTSVFSERLLGEARLELSRSHATDVALNSQPAVFVLDSFNGGGNQDLLSHEAVSQKLQFSDYLNYAAGRHTFKAGLLTDVVRLEDTDRSNFGGTFIFGTDFERNSRGLPVPGPVVINPLDSYRRTLLRLPGYRPLQFTINDGDPFVGLTQWEVGLFAQDDWRLPRLTLSYGLRGEYQTHLGKLNLAPRAALATRLFKQHEGILRVGAGLFYSRIDPDITLDTDRFNGLRQEELIVQRPAFFPVIPSVINRATSLITLRTKSLTMNAPYAFVSTVSYEQKLPAKLAATLSYTWERGDHLLRMRNINAPLPGSVDLRPVPAQGPILQYESSGKSTRHTFVAGLHGDVNAKLSVFGSYRLTFARSDTDSATTAPASSYDLSTEFGRAASDQRHQFYFEAYIALPWGFSFSPDLYAASGGPFNITTGSDDNADTLFTDRPAFAKAGDPGAIITPFGVFNPHPQPGDIIIPRNFGRGARELSVNLNLSKTLAFGSSSKSIAAEGTAVQRHYGLTFSVDIYNLLNHTNFGEFNGVVTAPLFGRPNSADDPRRINLGVRFSF